MEDQIRAIREEEQWRVERVEAFEQALLPPPKVPIVLPDVPSSGGQRVTPPQGERKRHEQRQDQIQESHEPRLIEEPRYHCGLARWAVVSHGSDNDGRQVHTGLAAARVPSIATCFATRSRTGRCRGTRHRPNPCPEWPFLPPRVRS